MAKDKQGGSDVPKALKYVVYQCTKMGPILIFKVYIGRRGAAEFEKCI